MSLVRPTLSDLIARAKSDLDAHAPGVLASSDRDTLAYVLAGAMHAFYGRLDWAARQLFPDQADPENVTRWASVWGLVPKAASAAKGHAVLSGNTGAAVPMGTLLQGPSGQTYTTDAAATLANGGATVAITASQGGVAGNLPPATPLTMALPVAGVASSAVVDAAGLKGGLDAESADDLLTRLLERLREPPHGGSAHDYVTWALEIPGVTRAWCFPHFQGFLGHVGVTFLCDGDGLGALAIPNEAKRKQVEDRITGADGLLRQTGYAPLGASVAVFIAQPVAINLSLKVLPNTAEVKAQVTAALQDFFKAEGVPKASILLSHLHEAISLAAGEQDHELVAVSTVKGGLTTPVVPLGNVVCTENEIPVLGSLTWL